MTAAPLTPLVLVESVEAAETALRKSGLRVSAARRVVLAALFHAGRPLSAEAIADGVPGRVPRSDLTSVYRNLETLEALGLVRHVHLGHGPGLYALTRDPEHEYLVCDGCRTVVALEAGELDDIRTLIREQHGFVAGFRHFPLVGLCASCAEGRDTSPTDHGGSSA